MSMRKNGMKGGSAMWELKKMEEELAKGESESGSTLLPKGARHTLPVRKCTMEQTEEVKNGDPEEGGFDLVTLGKSSQWVPVCAVGNSKIKGAGLGSFAMNTKKRGTIGLPRGGPQVCIALKSWTQHVKRKEWEPV